MKNVLFLLLKNYPIFRCVLLGADFAELADFTFGAVALSVFGAAFLVAFFSVISVFSSVLSCIIAEKIWCLRVFIVLLYAVRQVGLAGYVCTTESL